MENTLTTKQIFKQLLTFTVPLILSGILQQIFNWVDAYIVGNVIGENALTQIGVTTSLYNLFITTIVGFTSGLSILAAQQYGIGNKGLIQKLLSSYSKLIFAVITVICCVSIIFTEQILHLLNTPANAFSGAKAYISIMLVGIPFISIYNVYSGVLRGIGNSKTPFIAILISSSVNVVLDLLFVAVINLEVAGAAIATVISQVIMTVFIVIYTAKKYPWLKFKVFEKPDKGIFYQGNKYSLPPAIQSGVSSTGNILLQKFMNSFGSQTVAAITTAYRVDTILLLPITNFSTGISTLVAQNLNSTNKALSKKIFKLGIILMAIISLMLTAVILIFGETLISMFGLTAKSTAIGKSFFITISKFYIIYGLSMAIRGYLEGISDMIFSGIAGILSLAVRIICSYLFAGVFNNMVIAYAEAFSWIFLFIIFVARYFYKNHKFKIRDK